jgi:peptidylprolyl isomerase
MDLDEYLNTELNFLSYEKIGIFITAILVLVVLFGVFQMNDNKKVKLETSEGDIVIELYLEMPITSGNFEKLVSEGFYDGVIFHRIIDGFMIQGGDPTGTGMGGPGYQIKDEFTKSDLDKNDRGTISMANAGPNTGGSQFFINLVDNNFLDGKHPVFGKVVEGIDIVDKIAKVETNAQDKPLKDVVIVKASVI